MITIILVRNTLISFYFYYNDYNYYHKILLNYLSLNYLLITVLYFSSLFFEKTSTKNKI